MFSVTDFDIFNDQTLAGRLGKIQTILDPKFETLGALLIPRLTAENTMPEQYFHMAKHLRRHKNPPTDTWLAISANRRGYKMGPHIEVGFWDDRLFIWAALLVETKPQYHPQFDAWWPLVQALGPDWQVSGNHMKKAAEPLTEASYQSISQHYQTTNSGEWLIGQTYLKSDALFETPAVLWTEIQNRVAAIAPLYAAMQV
ncbi:DUF1054 family protein [Lacticaseibacillus brantae]|uniref:Uncharacterized protein n=1 Tax=Lacticaseibacillus brantae DSM 23927 TaxID=1423727 RepID=A0A0R2B006_9LACO|nr:DUF1054 family protein [Lacticaseibacillus brantae]KRM72913.1 hypothetical protein FC34_GL000625 [Lacticaseibacillus brantae DSM 23927]